MEVYLILRIFVILLLVIYFFKGRNAVWGGFTFGLIIGLGLGIFQEDFWSSVEYGATVGTILGFLIEMIDKFLRLIKR